MVPEDILIQVPKFLRDLEDIVISMTIILQILYGILTLACSSRGNLMCRANLVPANYTIVVDFE